MKGLIALGAIAVLSGCASSPAPVSENWTRWACDSQAAVDWRYSDTLRQTVDVRLVGADKVYRLAPEGGAATSFYSDGVLAFHMTDDKGLVYWVATNDLIGRDCEAPAP